MGAPTYSGIVLYKDFASTGTPANTVPAGVTLAPGRYATGTYLQLDNSAVAPLVGGMTAPLTPVLDASDPQTFLLFLYRWLTRPFTQDIGNLSVTNGLRIAVLSDAANYKEYIVDGNDSVFGATNHTGVVPVLLQINATPEPNTAVRSVGALNTSAIAQFGCWWPQNNTSYTSFALMRIYSGKAIVMAGGEVGDSLSITGAIAYLNGLLGVSYLASEEAGYAAIKFLGVPLQVGDGMAPTYWVDASAETLQFQRLAKDALYDSTYKNCIVQANDGYLGLEFVLTAADVVDLAFKTIQADAADQDRFIVNPDCSVLATLRMASCNLIRFGPVTLRSPFVGAFFLFIQCGTVALNDCVLRSCSILSSTAAIAVLASTTATVSGSAIDAAATGLQITAAGDYTNLELAISHCDRAVNLTTAIISGQTLDLSRLAFADNTLDLYWEGSTGSIDVIVAQSGLTTGTAGGTINLRSPQAQLTAANFADGVRVFLARRQTFVIASAAIAVAADAIALGNDLETGDAFAGQATFPATMAYLVGATGATLPTTSPPLVSGNLYYIANQADGVVQLAETEGGPAIAFADAGIEVSGQLFTLVCATELYNSVVSGGNGLRQALSQPDQAQIEIAAQAIAADESAATTLFHRIVQWSVMSGATIPDPFSLSSHPDEFYNRLVGATITSERGEQVVLTDTPSGVSGLAFDVSGNIEIDANAIADGVIAVPDAYLWSVYMRSTELGIRFIRNQFEALSVMTFDLNGVLTIDNVADGVRHAPATPLKIIGNLVSSRSIFAEGTGTIQVEPFFVSDITRDGSFTPSDRTLLTATSQRLTELHRRQGLEVGITATVQDAAIGVPGSLTTSDGLIVQTLTKSDDGEAVTVERLP